MKKMVVSGFIIHLFFFLFACAPITETQKPSLPLGGGEVEKELNNLSKANPIGADELRRLPELSRRLDEKGVLALNRIVIYYTQSQNSEEVKQIFNRILSIGRKERRKFSTPLQALFWLAEERELPLTGNLLEIYSKEKYRGVNRHLGEDGGVIIFVYNIWKRTYDTDKWKDPDEIMDRLNSPHLFDLFFRDNIAYDFDKRRLKMSDRRYYENWGSYLQSAKATIKRRKGTCDDAANMADEILTKAGYNVKPLQVLFRRPSSTGSNRHWVAVLKEGGLFYKIADDEYVKEGIVGPFKSAMEIGEKVAESLGTAMADYSLSQIPIIIR